MLHKMYSVFDSCVCVYDRPFVASNDSQACRSFGDIAQDVSHPFGMHPEHYSLFRIGAFDDSDGTLFPEMIVCVARAHELVAARKAFPKE